MWGVVDKWGWRDRGKLRKKVQKDKWEQVGMRERLTHSGTGQNKGKLGERGSLKGEKEVRAPIQESLRNL